eukprot:CAMPEP_0170100996 /NCGR_PEP_ID=MMETSP0020_2-20130122/1992_1 /TAXON_ID=98059 /ORGANISM="Dinobryon sp., Strain UTEXLB2267" /LENGTH=90 /DNA_ID=CAMNT_0010324001 /DNA_START=357 /DNA_END=629 /DNA_ORIENTATION=-
MDLKKALDTGNYEFSPLKTIPYYILIRQPENRPTDANEWTLCERLDWEMNGINFLPNQLTDYRILLDQSDIDQALAEIRRLNETAVISYP